MEIRLGVSYILADCTGATGFTISGGKYFSNKIVDIGIKYLGPGLCKLIILTELRM